MREKPEKLAAMVIGYAGGASVKPIFRLDTIKYSWVKDFVKDQKLRHKIKELQGEIAATNVLPICKSELRGIFEARIKQINEFRVQQMIAHLKEVQKREKPLLNELSINEWKVNGAWINPILINLSSTDIDYIFSQIQNGTQDEKIKKTVKQLQEKIIELEKIISDELSPRERWYHRDSGLPEPYPQGCRWTSFVEVWKNVAAKFNDKVDVEGYRLKTPKEFEAYGLLGLDGMRKQQPLREPYG